jgi:hypothetical protein
VGAYFVFHIQRRKAQAGAFLLALEVVNPALDICARHHFIYNNYMIIILISVKRERMIMIIV